MRSISAHDDRGELLALREPPLVEGELLDGRYLVGPRLGGGGMATVFRATHVALARPVAVKILSSVVRDVPGMVSRFLHEARAATRLRSEHVVRVFDVGSTPDGAPYMVMELLEGQDLGQQLDGGRAPSPAEAIDYVLQSCEALAEVHGLGMVHRDVKPGNLFITCGADGRACVKLIDFGISCFGRSMSEPSAHAEALSEDGARPTAATDASSPEIVMGSPRYMAPEQMESALTADARADIWGLGALLYEMLVGRAPFDGESLFDIYAATVRADPPRPSKLRPGLPAGLDRVVLDCLRVDPNERTPDVASLARALAPFGDASAGARAEAIAHVLEAARARSGTASGARTEPLPASQRAPALLRRRQVILAATIATLGVTLAARSFVGTFGALPTTGTRRAAAGSDGPPMPSAAGASAPVTATATPVEAPAREPHGSVEALEERRRRARPSRARAATQIPPRWSRDGLAPAALGRAAVGPVARPRVPPLERPMASEGRK